MNMIHTRKDREQSHIPSQETATWVRDVLEPDQLSTAKRRPLAGRRQLSPGTLIILWALRLYVVVMMFIIAYQIWIAIQS
jgi:hypothetical protein